jgi:hypothetical protein
METFVKQMNVPFVSSALGDEGDFAGIEEYMAGYPGLSGYAPANPVLVPGSPSRLGDEVGDETVMY